MESLRALMAAPPTRDRPTLINSMIAEQRVLHGTGPPFDEDAARRPQERVHSRARDRVRCRLPTVTIWERLLMRQDWPLEQLVEEWNLEEGDRKLLGDKSGATRLGFALLLKFFQIEGRIPTYAEEIPAAAVEFVADQVNVDRALCTKYAWTGRTIEYHRHQIRDKYGTHPATEDEEDQLADWLADQVCPVEVDRDELAQTVERRCRTLRVEPPSPGQIERVVASGVRRFEEAFTTSVMTRLWARASATGSRVECWAPKACCWP